MSSDPMRAVYRKARSILRLVQDRIEAFLFYRLAHPGRTIHITGVSHTNIEKRGLFSIFIEALDIITARAEKEIDIDYQHTLYNNSPDQNMWTYYFDPVQNTIRRTFDLGFLPARAYKYRKIKEDQRLLDVLHTSMEDRVRVRSEIREKALSFYRENLPESGVIGVHIRGTDHIRMYGNDVGIDRYFDTIDRLLSAGYTRIFLATDDEHFYRAFKERYGDTVVTYSKIRASGTTGLHFQTTAPREAGEEVVVDWLLLGKTQYFLHGESNVATAVLILNPSMPRENMAIC
ncbi:MAG: hypothetical protein KGJ31_02690 [Patescibacteria group bacterium]|nr:hypothetical protein [Patescibacteria group bacterium]